MAVISYSACLLNRAQLGSVRLIQKRGVCGDVAVIEYIDRGGFGVIAL